MSNMKFTRKHYHDSPKAGVIYCDSSYEVKAALMLDADPVVLFYETQQRFNNKDGKLRILDFLASLSDGKKKLIEVKPERRLDEFKEQIADNKAYALQNGFLFELWTEKELGFATPHSATAWADQYYAEVKGIDFPKIRKERAVQRSIKHYHKHIATDTVEVWCEFCKEIHNPLRLTYDKNIKRNSGQYICEKHGGFIAGSKPKKKKENPYSVDGKKQCNGCQEIKPFEDFGVDGTKSDGYSTRCKKCRAKVAKAKYQQKI